MSVKERKLREFKKREEKILTAAYELLIELEPIQMTMEMIAEKIEIGRGTIYKHFKSKDEIYARLIIKRRSQFLEKLILLKEEKEDLLKKLIKAYIEYSTNDINSFIVHKKCIVHIVKPNIKDELIATMQEQSNKKIKLIETIMSEALKNLDLEPINVSYLIYASWGMLKGAMDFMIENRDTLIEEKELFQEAIEQIFLQGIL